MLEATHIGVKRSGSTLLQDVSVRVQPGRVLAVLGPNGAGKSTLLSVLTGMGRPTTGELQLDGKPLSSFGRRERAQRLGVLSQSSPLAFDFTALEVVLLGRAPHSPEPESLSLQHAERTLAAVDATHLAGRRYLTLSGGERQRVQFARVLAQLSGAAGKAQRYLLVDEPTASLDVAHSHILLAAARALAVEEGLGVLAILHDVNAAAQYADDLLLLDKGRVVESGPLTDALRVSSLREVFGVPWALVPSGQPHPASFFVPLSPASR